MNDFRDWPSLAPVAYFQADCHSERSEEAAFPRREQQVPRSARDDGFEGIIAPYMLSFSDTLRICTPCTSEEPPRIAAATCTASVICSRLEPFSKQACV